MSRRWRWTLILMATATVLAVVSSLYSVSEREKVAVLRLGQVLRVDDPPGMHVKLPFIDELRSFDTRLLTTNFDSRPFHATDGKGNIVDVLVDVAVRWRIVDVHQYLTQAASVRMLLEQLVSRRLGDEFGRPAPKGLLGGDWHVTAEALTHAATDEARRLGIELVELRVQRVALTSNTPVYDRMRSDRKGLAKKLEEDGKRAAKQISDQADRDGKKIEAEGYAKAERIRGEADARAAAIDATAANQAPEFFEFYRSLNAYKEISKKDGVLVLDPNADFFKYLKKPTR